MFIDNIRWQTRKTRQYFGELTYDKNAIAFERNYARKRIQLEAEDGSWCARFDNLYPENITWLKQQGFTVVADNAQDGGYVVWWGTI